MSTRGLYLLGVALLLAVQSGCCCGSGGETYCGSQCGQLFWHEWFSIPPNCCDPCSCCGNNVGPKNNYVRSSMPPMGRPWNWGPDGDAMQASYGVPNDTSGDTETIPPGQPIGRQTGYSTPWGLGEQMSPAMGIVGPSGGTQASAAYGRAGYQGQMGPVDSQPTSRTLGGARRLSDYFR